MIMHEAKTKNIYRSLLLSFRVTLAMLSVSLHPSMFLT